jgi:hypothetical protein
VALQITGKRSPKLSRGLKTSASAATARREASAPEARCGGNVATAWRAPRPEHRQAVTFAGAARLVMRKRLSALSPPFFFRGRFRQWLGDKLREAIQGRVHRLLDCFVASLLAMTVQFFNVGERSHA